MPALNDVQLATYLQRIGHDSPVRPDRTTLQTLHRLHPEALPFENLDSFMGRPVAIDIAGVYDKLVLRGRGGYCFEQNTLFAAALETVGFEVQRYAARVLWDFGPDVPVPLTHMVLHVCCENVWYLADVGFGRLSLTAPLRRDAAEQQTPHERYRLTHEPSGWLLSSQVGDTWRTLYRHSTELAHTCDYVQMNWFVSTHPESRFVRHLIAARVRGEERLTLLDNRLTIRRRDDAPRTRLLETGEALRACLEQDFAMRIGTDPVIDARLAELSRITTSY